MWESLPLWLSEFRVTSSYPGKDLPNHSRPVPISQMGKLRPLEIKCLAQVTYFGGAKARAGIGFIIFRTYSLTYRYINEVCDARRKEIIHITFLYCLFSQSSTFVLDGKAKADMTFLKNAFLNVLY